jgi:WD repeat-containing protein 61
MPLEVDKVRNLLIVGHNFEGIHVIDLESRNELWSINLTNQSIFDIKVSGNDLFVATADGMVIILDIEKRAVKKHLKISDKSVRVLAINPDNRTLAAGLSDHTVKIFDLITFEPIHNLVSHSNSVFALGFCPKPSNINQWRKRCPSENLGYRNLHLERIYCCPYVCH